MLFLTQIFRFGKLDLWVQLDVGSACECAGQCVPGDGLREGICRDQTPSHADFTLSQAARWWLSLPRVPALPVSPQIKGRYQIKMGNWSGKFLFSKNYSFRLFGIRERYRLGFTNNCVNNKKTQTTPTTAKNEDKRRGKLKNLQYVKCFPLNQIIFLLIFSQISSLKMFSTPT